MNEAQEQKLAAILRSRPDLLTPEQEELAKTQHYCRLLNHSPRACENLRHSVALACSECLLAATCPGARS